MYKYQLFMYWNEEDQIFVVEVPELPGCMAHGKTQVSALENIQEAIQLWIDTAQEFSDPVPVPRYSKLISV